MSQNADASHYPAPLRDITTYDAGIAQAAAHRLLKRSTESYLAVYKLSMMQWFIVGVIYRAGPGGIGITALSKRIDTNVPYVTNTVNGLVERDIITRSLNNTDNRARVLTINPDYVSSVKNIEKGLREQLRQTIYSRISAEELQAYIAVLYKLGSAENDTIVQ